MSERKESSSSMTETGETRKDVASGVGILPRAITQDLRNGEHGDSDDALMEVEDIDRMFPLASVIAVVAYFSLVAGLYIFIPQDQWVYLDDTERQAARLALLINIVGIVFMLPTLFIRSSQSWSGIIVATISVQMVANLTNFIMATYPVPVAYDPYTRSRVHLMRWCEWVPLAGLMTFLSDAVDLRKPAKGKTTWDCLKSPVYIALLQSLSCACAFYFPFAPTVMHWVAAMFVAVVTYLAMFPRLWTKHQNFNGVKQGFSSLDKEKHDRVKFSRNLFFLCTFVWTILVLMYFWNMGANYYFEEGHYLRHECLPMILDTIFDTLAKVLYMKVIVEVHILVFDRDLRAQRQLLELRKLMAVLWDTSSDAIVISIRQDKVRARSLFSPAFVRIIGAELPENIKDSAAFLLETHHSQGVGKDEQSFVLKANYVDCSEVPMGVVKKSIRTPFSPTSALAEAALSVANASWSHSPGKQDSPSLIVHTQPKLDSGLLYCEIQVSQHSTNAVVSVIRDVTERYRRFEAERRAHAETRARQRDAQAVNRFTRHEVKNGLMAGIEICNALKTCFSEAQEETKETQKPALLTERAAMQHRRYVKELETSMHEMLDIVLAEAMARDVIHEVYHPKREQVDVMALLANINLGLGNFQLQCEHPNMPSLFLDPQLVRHIHRNAVSNACKYGCQGSPVVTKVAYIESTKEFRMQVLNEPGPGHETLLAMGSTAEDAVFAQGACLHAHLNQQGNRMSSGDGAWIMQKCAKTMGGSCSIKFELDCVIFTFVCPAEECLPERVARTRDFQVPHGTWAIGVDDSKMQRKTMWRIFANSGVQESHTIILGSTPAEVANLQNVVSMVLGENESSKLLVLMDENLDFGDTNGVLSGSKAMKEVLDAIPEAQQARVLALVRSANDSAEDVAIYMQRLHGFFPKAPMSKDQTKETMSNLWNERFPQSDDDEDVLSRSSEGLGSIDKDDILQSLQRVEKLLAEDAPTQDSWSQIWQALHALKGDLMVLDESEDFILAINLIAKMKSPEVPLDFEKKWAAVQRATRNALGKGLEESDDD